MRPIAATLAAASAGALLYRWWFNTTSTEGSAQQDQQKEEVQEEQEMEEESGQQNYSVVLYYLYVEIPDTNLLRAWHEDTTSRLQLSGRVLIATEGINGTLSGSTEAVDEYITNMEAFCFEGGGKPFAGGQVDWKRSRSQLEPFPDTKISIVKEVVSTGGRIRAPTRGKLEGGQHLTPEEFHQGVVSLDPSTTVLIDVRNKNEYAIGHFDGALNPNTRTFCEFPKFLDDHAEEMKGKKVLMYCTGGIRCEKASLYLREKGFDDVSQLQGGIHRYMEQFPEGGKFLGKNYVFDRRIALAAAKGSGEVVGRCCCCQSPYDQFQGDRVCCVCRDPLLVCPACRLKQRGVFYCEAHMSLHGLYYFFLDSFDRSQLTLQLAGLQAALEAMLRGGGALTKPHKNRRRTVHRQIEKLQERRRLLAAGAVTVAKRPASEWRCRSCGEWNSECDGNCWGYFKAPHSAQGGATSLKAQRKLPHRIQTQTKTSVSL